MDLENLKGRIGFLGAGNMASALARGFLSGGLEPGRVSFFDPDVDRARDLSMLGLVSESSGAAVVSSTSIVIIAVKPGLVRAVLESARGPTSPLWISVAAGIPTDALETALGDGARVVRAMPNTGALVGASATAIAGGRHASPSDLEQTALLLGTVGSVAVVSESMMNAVTGLSGSGPAYVMMFIEALADGGVKAGLPRDIALRLATETVRGGATLVAQTGKHPAVLKDQVASPGGTTIAGIAALESLGFRAATISAVAAATARADELSRS